MVRMFKKTKGYDPELHRESGLAEKREYDRGRHTKKGLSFPQRPFHNGINRNDSVVDSKAPGLRLPSLPIYPTISISWSIWGERISAHVLLHIAPASLLHESNQDAQWRRKEGSIKLERKK